MSSRSYRRQLKAAIRRTHDWDLGSFQSVYLNRFLGSTEPQAPFLHKQRELWYMTENMSRIFSIPPQERTNRCIEVHIKLAIELMSNNWPVLPVMTIGAVFWNGDNCFKVTERSLMRALAAPPKPGVGIALHVWLTFPDCTILDFSLPSWQCKCNGEEMNLMETGGLRIFTNPDTLRDNLDYRPLLVGPGFLIRTSSVNPLDLDTLLSVEQEWLQRILDQ